MDLPAKPAVKQSSEAAETRTRILLVDDSRVMRLAIMKILGTDYDVVQAENGAAAWDRLSSDPGIFAVLTDIQMPVMDGYELICRIRAADDIRLRNLPVMTITGSDEDSIKQRALACGATDFVIKPLDATQLRARVQAYVRYDQNARNLIQRSQALEGQAITDPQTGLRSRRYLMQRGEQDIAYAQRHVQDLALLRIDIDRFKNLYRTHGDDMVDQLIPWLAKLLFSTARMEDTVSRVAGAEFAILATNTGMEQAMLLCGRVMEAVGSQPFQYGDKAIPLSLSIGVASLRDDRCETIEVLYTIADQRLCHAVSEGGNRICGSLMDGPAATVEEVTLLPIDVQAGATKNVTTHENDTQSEPTHVGNLPVGDSRAEIIAEAVPAVPVVQAEPPVADELDRGLKESRAEEMEPVFPELLSVDKALMMISAGKEKVLMPYLEMLMREIQPLVDLWQHRRSARPPDHDGK